MDTFTSLILGIVNFLILCALTYWLFGSSMNHFFHARRDRMRKHMLDSVMTLRHARGRAARSKEEYEGLPKDIENRKIAISKNCERECRQIIEEAHKKAEAIIKAGERRADKERRRHATLLRERLMRAAFRLAEERIRKESGPDMQREYVERGLHQLARMKVPAREAANLAEE